MPVDLQQRWHDRLDRVETLQVASRISADDCQRLASFPEHVVLADILLDPPATESGLDAQSFYLLTTAELARRFARHYTILGTRDPLYRYFCKSHVV